MMSFLTPGTLSILALLAVVSFPALAQSPEEKGLMIAEEADRRDLGWGDSQTEGTMILKNRQGQTSQRRFRTQALENPDPAFGDKGLTVFDFPRDIAGTALLSHTKILDPDDQWLYLPALKRVKRISSANKSGPFVGSEFAYEDLSSVEVGKYNHRWLRDEACPDNPDLTCFVIEQEPLYENSGYTKRDVWLDQDEYRAQKIDFYDRKGDLLKTLIPSEYQHYLDRYWRAQRMQMDNHQTGRSTSLTFSPYSFIKNGLSEKDFIASRLKRSR